MIHATQTRLKILAAGVAAAAALALAPAGASAGCTSTGGVSASDCGPRTVPGAKAKLVYKRDYPVTRNHERQTAFAAEIARDVVGKDRVDDAVAPVMGAEDFSYMLEARPGAFIFVGNGDTAGLHHPAYDFNDELIPVGASYWVKLVETALRG